MPFGDRTGPAGTGPMTGRGAGYCAGFNVPGYANPIVRGVRGFGFGRGGWNRRNMYYATGLTGWQWAGYRYAAPPPYVPNLTKEQELDALKVQAEQLQNTLDSIQKRMEELEAQQKSGT